MLANLTEILAFVAVIAALGAWWISWRENRHNNMVMVKLKRFRSSSIHDRSGSSYKLEIWIVNRGIQLQNISMSLCFYGPGKSGNISLLIPLSKYSEGVYSTFLRGTTASFVLSSSDNNTSHFLELLRDIQKQRPSINLYNSSFLARSFPIYSKWDCLKKLWNRLSFRFSFKRRIGEGHDGKGVFKYYQLPYFEIRSEELQLFLKGFTQTDVEAPKATEDEIEIVENE